MTATGWSLPGLTLSQPTKFIRQLTTPTFKRLLTMSNDGDLMPE
jgi:hypothetical protein